MKSNAYAAMAGIMSTSKRYALNHLDQAGPIVAMSGHMTR